MLSLGVTVGGCEQDDLNERGEGEVVLDPIPQEEIACTGEESELEGPCCVDVYCTETDGSGSCPDASARSADEVTGLSLGSGECACAAINGPYAPASPESDQPCCYLVGIQWCSGRPIYAAGITVRATAVHGLRWFG